MGTSFETLIIGNKTNPASAGFVFDGPQMTKAPSQGLFHFAVFHQQVLDVSLTLDPGLHHLVKCSFRLYLIDEDCVVCPSPPYQRVFICACPG